MKKITTKQFKHLLTKPESEWLDFKKEWTDKKCDLVHDILCLANSYAPKKRFLVFGVANDGSLIGISGELYRKKQADLISMLRDARINRLPAFKLYTIIFENKEFDILEIEDKPIKPYFLNHDYKSDKSTVRAGAIYTRNGDSNTPLGQSAEELQVERMYKERFGIYKTALERGSLYLKDVSRWKYGYNEHEQLYFYYELFPEFTLIEHAENQAFEEPWTFRFANKSASKNSFFFKFHGTVLVSLIGVWVDGGNHLIIKPKQFFCDSFAQVFMAYYFEKESLELLINKMLQNCYPNNTHENLMFPEFESEESAARSFKINFKKGKRKYSYYILDPISRRYLHSPLMNKKK